MINDNVSYSFTPDIDKSSEQFWRVLGSKSITIFSWEMHGLLSHPAIGQEIDNVREHYQEERGWGSTILGR